MHPSLVLHACVSWQPSSLLPSLYRWCAYKQVCVCVCVCVWEGEGELASVFTHLSRGSQLYMTVLCRNICDRDQNWIKRTKPFFESWSRDQGSPQTAKIKGSRTCSSNFDLWPIKSSHQAHFLLIKNLDPGRKCFSRRHTPWFVDLDVCVCVCSHAVKTYQQGDDQLSAQVVHWTSSLPLSLRPSSSNPSKVESSWKILLFIVSVDCTLFSSPNWPCKGGWQRSHCDVT